jgi:RNA polymerase-binding transcription factor DksA
MSTKQALELRLEEVNHRRAVLAQRSQPEEWDAGGDNTPFSERGDASRAMEEREADRLALSLLSEDAVDLENALERICAGTYGRCLDCGMPIARKRLAALPAARYCLNCETRQGGVPAESIRG